MASDPTIRMGKGSLTENSSDIPDLCTCLDIPEFSSKHFSSYLPFVGVDTSVGCENELQAAVIGVKDNVDLPRKISESTFFRNSCDNGSSSPYSRSTQKGINEFLENNDSGVWENSWVQVPLETLKPGTIRILARDFSKEPEEFNSLPRDDLNEFVTTDRLGRESLRLPISYLLKLAMTQFLEEQSSLHGEFAEEIDSLYKTFTNDNCSPEIISSYLSYLDRGSRGLCAVGEENARRLLLLDLLLQYATRAFGLEESGQRPVIYSSPQTPYRQSRLTGHLPDNFYRKLYVNPSLSGPWQSEQKHRYMELCHEILSRSRLTAIRATQNAGLIKNNLVVLPNIATSSLSTNGTHISIGSRRLEQAAQSGKYDRRAEKYYGDLVCKIFEHFLPLFVGLYSAAPWRHGFSDFHPESVLNFLPHQLTPEYVALFWQQWKKKARLTLFGKSMTPVGPQRMDSALAAMFGLQGDYVPDTRLLEYFVALPSTQHSSALDGAVDNDLRLKEELAHMGVFDERLSTYLPFKLRERAKHGFSGYEGRHYSLFPNLQHDLPSALGLQTLITAYAYQCIAGGVVTHQDIPDDPVTESERRHMFFAASVGLPYVYVRATSNNRLLQRVVRLCSTARRSRRYGAYLKIPLRNYQNALLKLLRTDAPELIETMGYESIIADLDNRINVPEVYSAEALLTQGVLNHAGVKSPFSLSAREYNLAVESYYQGPLKLSQLREGLDVLQGDLNILSQTHADNSVNKPIDGKSPAFWIEAAKKEHTTGLWPEKVVQALLSTTLQATCIHMRANKHS